MTAVQKWLVSLTGTAVTAAIAYVWLDRSIALLAHRDAAAHQVFNSLTHIPDPVLPVAIAIFAGAGLYVMSGRTLSKIYATAMLCSVSAMIAEVTKSILKYVFGRTWPETWVRDNPSFIHDGVYGFNLFHGGDAYASFPSGHLSVTAAVVSVLWIAYPALRPLCALAVLAVMAGLIGANYHFLSDVIAGCFVGVSTGWMVMALWQSRDATQAGR
jgi:membrane-associated phospholipid phosphatase